MSDEQLCTACQTFLRGESLYHKRDKFYLHQPSAQSFKEAIDLPCAICVRLWAAMKLYHGYTFDVVPELARTTYESPRIRRQDRGTISRIVPFECGDYHINLTLEPWEAKPNLYSTLFPANSGNDKALDFFVSQYKRCREEHSLCQLNAPHTDFHPTRVIDVGVDGESLVRLCEGDCLNLGTPYVALSHCWGRSRPFILTEATAVELRRGVAIASLPKTFLDAITATRKLRFQYIWIDSLCIFQDNLDDWHEEAGRMHDIYSKAACCIAATAAEDSNTGLFFNRDPLSLTPIKVEATWAHTQSQPRFPPPGTYWCGCHWITATSAVDSAPLNQRAWVAQERYLSPRIMHFSWEVLFWECQELIANETHPDGVPDLAYTGGGNYDTRSIKTLLGGIRLRRLESNTRGQSNTKDLELSLGSTTSTSSDIYRAWCTFRTAYTGYGMTKEKDVLVALSGIAQDVAEAMDDELVAGLWKQRFAEDLCWQSTVAVFFKNPDMPYKPSKWRAPSWSWASTLLPVSPSDKVRSRKIYASLQVMATLNDVSITAKSSGELESASATLQCRLIPAHLQASAGDWHGYLIFADELIKHRFSAKLNVQLDGPSPAAEGGDVRKVDYLLLRHFFDIGNVEAYIEGLVIAPSDDHPGCYERLGVWGSGYGESVDRETHIVTSLLSKFRETDDQTIDLV
ncbi:heterokaryon incompatibility protein-domain-containing protein [Pyrenochaeta sp. MPI-SDFR-AT-0127]|nr:heterokaryon incompatibility protein-domain-containing protein [Pyrenochaeta sp. MPI-SDFR-AT-0127]